MAGDSQYDGSSASQSSWWSSSGTSDSTSTPAWQDRLKQAYAKYKSGWPSGNDNGGDYRPSGGYQPSSGGYQPSSGSGGYQTSSGNGGYGQDTSTGGDSNPGNTGGSGDAVSDSGGAYRIPIGCSMAGSAASTHPLLFAGSTEHWSAQANSPLQYMVPARSKHTVWGDDIEGTRTPRRNMPGKVHRLSGLPSDPGELVPHRYRTPPCRLVLQLTPHLACFFLSPAAVHYSPAGRPFAAQLLPCQAWRSCPHMVLQHCCNSTVLLPWLCDAALIQQLWREPGQGQCGPPPPSIHLDSASVMPMIAVCHLALAT
jgi:hypothetical protein